jgi:hypothetical protein
MNKKLIIGAVVLVGAYLAYKHLTKPTTKESGMSSASGTKKQNCPYAGRNGCPSTFKAGTGGCMACERCIRGDEGGYAGEITYDQGILRCSQGGAMAVNPDGTPSNRQIK